MSWLLLPACLQAACMAADELYFHRRRGLPQWERRGHPLDTLTLLACLCLALGAPFTAAAQHWYLVLAVVSCLCITKDEFVHAGRCEAGEHWVHALLFVLHPVVLGCVWLLWRQGDVLVVAAQAAVVAGFLIYQTVYWNVLHDR